MKITQDRFPVGEILLVSKDGSWIHQGKLKGLENVKVKGEKLTCTVTIEVTEDI